MIVTIIGLGYVGCVNAACFAQMGHTVIGVDIDTEKVQAINLGRSPIVEKGIGAMVHENVQVGKLSASLDLQNSVLLSELTMICVGTPSQEDGSPNLTFLQNVITQVGQTLAQKDSFHTVVIRSTIPPGTCHAMGKLLEQTSGSIINRDFALVYNPEFLREGSGIDDFYHPPYIVIGSESCPALEKVAALYPTKGISLHKVDIKTAEIIKFINNSFHALKVAFANEISSICQALDIDDRLALALFCQDTKLNISTAYLKPGLPYGGSCLPKDVKALSHMAECLNISSPIVSAIEESNQAHKLRILNKILSTNCSLIGLVGLSFKAGTDDIRNSPMVELAMDLMERGYQVRIFDEDISRAYLQKSHKGTSVLSSSLTSLDAVIKYSEVIIIARESLECERLLQDFPLTAKAEERADYCQHIKLIIDLVGTLSSKSAQMRKVKSLTPIKVSMDMDLAV